VYHYCTSNCAVLWSIIWYYICRDGQSRVSLLNKICMILRNVIIPYCTVTRKLFNKKKKRKGGVKGEISSYVTTHRTNIYYYLRFLPSFLPHQKQTNNAQATKGKNINKPNQKNCDYYKPALLTGIYVPSLPPSLRNITVVNSGV